jgi:hypothetical protein
MMSFVSLAVHRVPIDLDMKKPLAAWA